MQVSTQLFVLSSKNYNERPLPQLHQQGADGAFPIKQSRRAITRPVKIDTIDIHCRCRMPEHSQDRMILCNGRCKQWYHDTCEHIEEHIWNSKLYGGTVETVKSELYTCEPCHITLQIFNAVYTYNCTTIVFSKQ